MAAKTGSAVLAGVIGNPVKHSLSPAIHEYWLQYYGKDAAYIGLCIESDDLISSLNQLTKMGFSGFNVTLPHKEAAFKLCYDVDDIARKIGAVNTVICEAPEKYYGKNTDMYGFCQLAAENAIDLSENMRATLLGAGGSARAVAVGLLEQGCHKLTIANRTEARAASLRDALLGFYPAASIDLCPWEMVSDSLSTSNLLINTTQLGMVGQAALPVSVNHMKAGGAVIDIIYTPYETNLLRDAKAQGLRVANGLGMLIHQAVPGHADWFGTTPEVTAELYEYIRTLLSAS